jgi:predicted extracellular nuclease
MFKTFKYVLIAFILIGIHACKSFQKSSSNASMKPFRVMFYNVENLFDTWDDPAIQDEDFLPTAEMQWTEERLNKKLMSIAQVVHAVGDKSILPDVMGMAEVENRRVLDYLMTRTDLGKEGYSVVHYDSPDKRGIDVAMIYRKDRFKPLKTSSYAVVFPGDMEKPTRDILYVKGELPNKSHLHILVNHWPSRSGGQAETEGKRILAAQTAKRLCDSILFADKNSNIILMGDFNDYPDNKSIVETLGAQGDTSATSGSLFNLMAWNKTPGIGSHPYKGEWGFLDQFIMSSALKNGSNKLQMYYKNAQAFRPDFLVEKNEKYNNWQTKRTYAGPKYLGGYSDHLPIVVDVWMK